MNVGMIRRIRNIIRHSVMGLVALVMFGCTDPGANDASSQRLGSVDKSAESVVALTASGGIAGALGSGVIVGADGYVLVADHVASSGLGVEIVTRRGLRPVRVIARDPVLDLRLVRSAGLRGPVIPGLRETPLQQGMKVWAVGVGAGTPEPRSGTVIATDTVVDAVLPTTPLIETDIRLAPGDSGGALLDGEGRLVGLLAATRHHGDRVRSLAIPAGAIGRFLAYVEAGEVPTRGWLGLYLHTGRPSGLVVASMAAGSPAIAGGLKAGDRITRINGEPVGDRARFQALIGALSPGDPVQLEFVREGEALRREIRTGRLPQAMSGGGSPETVESD